MFIRKWLKLVRKPMDEGESGGGAATVDTSSEETTFDMESAVDSIGAGLGFKTDEPEAKTTDVAAPAAAAPTPATPKPEVPESGNQPPSTPTPASAVAPKTWKPEEAAAWAGIPETAKAAILRREEDMFRGIEQHRATAQFGNTVKQVIEPYLPILQQYGVDPVQNIKSLMDAHYTLATGTPESKTAMFQQLAKDYNINLAEVADGATYALPVDPQVAALQQQLAQVQSEQTRRSQAEYQAKQTELASVVTTFAADPKNIHFDDVADDVVKFLTADKNLTLEAAYEKAVWSNPVTREKEIARVNTEKQALAQADATKKAADAKKATAANLQTQPKAGAATLPLGSMDETMAETLAALKSR